MIVERAAEKLRPGDAIVFLGQEHRVAEIRPYERPLEHIIVATAHAADGWWISLERGSFYEVAA